MLQFGPEFLSTSLLIYTKIKHTEVYVTVLLVPNSYKNPLLTLRKKYRLEVFANRVLRRRMYLDLRVTW
jgi:hypothetical protein